MPTYPAASPWAAPHERARERESKREAVLLTAVGFFNARGYHATSLDDVATALGVTKPTIYRYFANKDEILFECTRRGLAAIAASAQAAAERGGTAAERLRALLRAYALVMTDDFGICVATTQDRLLAPQTRARFRALKREIDAQIRRVVAEGQADGSLDVEDVRITTFTAIGALNSIGRWFDPTGPMSAEEMADATVRVLMAGLLAKGRSPEDPAGPAA